MFPEVSAIILTGLTPLDMSRTLSFSARASPHWKGNDTRTGRKANLLARGALAPSEICPCWIWPACLRNCRFFQKASNVWRRNFRSPSLAYSYQYQPGINLIVGITHALNRTTSYAYDLLGNVTAITRLLGTPDAVTTSLSYEAKFSQITSITGPLNHTTSLAYDSKGNPLSRSSFFSPRKMDSILAWCSCVYHGEAYSSKRLYNSASAS